MCEERSRAGRECSAGSLKSILRAGPRASSPPRLGLLRRFELEVCLRVLRVSCKQSCPTKSEIQPDRFGRPHSVLAPAAPRPLAHSAARAPRTMATRTRHFTSSRVFSASAPDGAPGTVAVELPAGTISAVHPHRLERPQGTQDDDWVDVGDKWLLPGVRSCSLPLPSCRESCARRAGLIEPLVLPPSPSTSSCSSSTRTSTSMSRAGQSGRASRRARR